ncbi:YraN family protein [Mycobacterium sp. CBMA271]|uniref:YraN family protein n=1 Tax=unclassified Mycobacteroides TaxID=2618759 RepID=UPI0012DDA006|nr:MULTISPECIES: YraN family protein [unclassified Mycobacteroides]MUM16715.1 YraN family protein [Mycobacteroides sp. CBMA 326]MUM20188.1 YraN family protein [Mycobacteroides sp. CBMA 271]
MTTTTRAQIGTRGEDLAADHLRTDGFAILDRNWRCRYGEIDIIAADGEVLIFVEVKTRTGQRFGTPAEAVTHAKLRRLRRLAGIWLAAQKNSWPSLRIDVIEVRLTGPVAEITHIVGVS